MIGRLIETAAFLVALLPAAVREAAGRAAQKMEVASG